MPSSNLRNPLHVLKTRSINSKVYIGIYLPPFYQWAGILFQTPLEQGSGAGRHISRESHLRTVCCERVSGPWTMKQCGAR